MNRKKELQTFLREYREELRESAAGLLDEKMPPLLREDFDLFEKNGNRMVYQAPYFTRRKFLAVFGMEAILEREETGTVDVAVLKKLCGVLEEICKEETWALPAHVTRQKNPDWRNTVDLFASETAQTCTELLDRLRDFLPGRLQDTIETEVNRRVLVPFYSSRVPYAWWETGTNNWIAVCAGSIGSACMHLNRAGRRLPKPLPDCLDRVRAAMPYYFQSFTDDGACMEGLQYYTYGMTYFANFAWELYALTGENLFDRPDIAAFPAKCFFKDGVSLSFSDGSRHDVFRVGLQAVQALMYGDADFPAMERAAHVHSDSCYRFAGLKLDWFATKEYLDRLTKGETGASGEATPESEAPYRFSVFLSAQWCIAGAKNGTGFACKGGHNGESHNHNDIGHLIYEADGTVFLTDLGAGEYTRDYFSDRRYEAICNHSFGHSVPILNGQGQREGEKYRCTAFTAEVKEGVRPHCTAFAAEGAADIGTVSMEIGSAYSLSGGQPPLDGKAILREISFDLETGEAVVTDRFDFRAVLETAGDGFAGKAGESAKEGAACEIPGTSVTVTENLVTQIPPQINGNQIFLKKDCVMAVIGVEELSCGVTPVITTYDHRNHGGETEKVFCIRWEVPLTDGQGSCRFSARHRKADT